MISIKKLATIGAAGGLLLASAVPALAFGDGDFTFNFNKGAVSNLVVTKANTGLNSIGSGEDVDDSGIGTGDAGAIAEVKTVLNSNINGSCGCLGDSATVNINKGFVGNSVFTKSNTGLNSMGANDDVSSSAILTGNALSASVVTSVVNTNINF